MKDLVKIIAQALVDHPEKVEITAIAGGTTTIIELKVAKEDIGKVIGKLGRTANAMRIILDAAGKKLKKRVVLEILDD
jgi:predicted RNA-binding protein YlqC (UPF0109 family)